MKKGDMLAASPEETIQLKKLDVLFARIIESLEQGRQDIFDIAEQATKQVTRMEAEWESIKTETNKVIGEVDHLEKIERQARIKLMEVSRSFNLYTEADIQNAYESAQNLQIKLLELRQQEKYLCQRREELQRQIKDLREISKKADSFLNSTAAALKILQGNVEKINDALEEVYRRQQIGTWIITSQEFERRKIARELHDGPAQSLASMLIRLDLLSHFWQKEPERAMQEVEEVRKMGQSSLADVRRIMFDLKPTLLHEEGFISTLQEYFSDYEIKYNFAVDLVVFGKWRKNDMSMEIALFRLIQEALTNVRKHAGVNQAIVKIESQDDVLTVVIKDKGKGFDLNEAREKKESYGILGMKERVELFGGNIEIFSSPGDGTQVVITVPVKEEAKVHG